MGTHPIFESDFDCLTEFRMTSAIEALISNAKSKDDEVDQLRGCNEAERHWLARKQFLLKNWDDFTEENREKLECLSQCWSGLHFPGVGYPAQTVEKVREMSFGLPNMSDMLKDADQEIHSKEVKRRRDEQAKVITADNQNSRKRPAQGPPSAFSVAETKKQNTGNLDLPAPLKPNAKQIGLFLNLSSYCRKQGIEADLVHCVSMQKQRVSFLSEEVCPEQIQEMEKFYDRFISACDEVEKSASSTFLSLKQLRQLAKKQKNWRWSKQSRFFRRCQWWLFLATEKRQMERLSLNCALPTLEEQKFLELFHRSSKRRKLWSSLDKILPSSFSTAI